MNWPVAIAGLTTVTSYLGPWPYYISTAVAGLVGMVTKDPLVIVWTCFLYHGALAAFIDGDHLLRFIILHVVSLIGTIGTYLVQQKYVGGWCFLWWACAGIGLTQTTRVGNIFPIRMLLRFVIFYCADVASRYGIATTRNPLSLMRWTWTLFVHEILLVCLPLQLIYDVYYHRPK